jgi:8-oxo-dGTP pyrophosphatase MutT (NUDIX family)
LPVFYKALNSDTPQGQLYLAGRAGMARELFEETGLDMREDLDRMQAVVLRKTPQHYKDGGRELLPNEYKHRLFYILQVEDQDFLQVRNVFFRSSL